MGFFIAGGIVFLVAIILLGSGTSLQKSARNFDALKQPGKAEVVGYDHRGESNSNKLMVKLPALHSDKLYVCLSGWVNTADYPIGSIVDVDYAITKALGISSMEVHLVNSPPSDGAAAGRGMKIVGLVLLIISLCLLAVGLFSASFQ